MITQEDITRWEEGSGMAADDAGAAFNAFARDEASKGVDQRTPSELLLCSISMSLQILVEMNVKLFGAMVEARDAQSEGVRQV